MRDSVRAQISLEMQLYLALASMALLFAVVEFSKVSSDITSPIAGYRMAEFVDSLNQNLLSGNYSFVAYLPEGICNATVDGNLIDTVYGTFSSVSGLAFSGAPFCPDGGPARLYLTYNPNGGYVTVSR